MSQILLIVLMSMQLPGLAVDKVDVLLPHARHDPPRYFSNQKNTIYAGIVFDLLHRTFDASLLTLTYIPYERAIVEMQQKTDFDCIAPSPAVFKNQPGYFESKESVSSYHNQIITLASSNIALSAMDDIFRYKVLAFPGASKYLGDSFTTRAAAAPYYQELEHVLKAIPMLFLKRIEVLILDRHGFEYHAHLLGYDYKTGANKVQYHDFFPPIHLTITCRDPRLIARFDKVKRQLLSSGQWQTLISNNTQRMYRELPSSD